MRAYVIGSGPNGLAAAVVLAQAGLEVHVREAADTIGGGLRSAELTLPGFVHDVCSAIHPLAATSPFLRSVGLEEEGVRWIHPVVPLAHPLDDGTAVLLERSVDGTANGLGADGALYRRFVGPIARSWDDVAESFLGPLLRVPPHPFALARFGLRAMRAASGPAAPRFSGVRARGLFAGLAAHSFLPLGRPGAAAFGVVLAAAAHAVGWPFPEGGSQRIADALAARLARLGGTIETAAPVDSLAELDGLVLCDIAPREFLRLAGDRLPPRYRRALRRFRHGPGVFKLDWALDEPIPWRAADAARAGTVHLGGTVEEIAASESAIWRGKHVDRPYVLLAQPSLHDGTRAPAGRHTAWAYCHVPHGSTLDQTEAVERQVERFAPGFRDVIVGRSAMGPAEFERHNRNLVGGDITGGAQTLWQMVARPALRPSPYSTPLPNVFLCSASTPPGGGVHGMCGYWAAQAALRRL